MYKNILIATDGSELAQNAVAQGLTLAKALGARATIVTVTEPWNAAVSGEAMIAVPIDEYEKSAASAASAILASVSDISRKVGTPSDTQHIKDQHPAEGIVEAAKRIGADLIVMASHGRRGLSRMLLGSQANKVVMLSPIPILICKTPK